jgi:hypothetical protein
MPRISMLIPDDSLALIDSVAENRTAFMIEAATQAARRRKRELMDAEVRRICAEDSDLYASVSREWEGTLADGLDDDFENPYGSE